MKKITSIVLMLCIVLTLLLASCEKPQNDDPNGSDAATNDTVGQQSTNNATDATEKPTEKPTENPTEKPTEKPTDEPEKEPEDKPEDKPNEPGQTPDEPQAPEVKPTVSINGESFDWVMEEGISRTFATPSVATDAKFEVNIPVSKAGSYQLNFNTSLGFTTHFSSGAKKVTLSLPKTVFKEGEPIPVAYSTSGLTSNAANQNPWLCIAKNIGGVDKYICWDYIQKNTSGIIDARAMTGTRQDNSLLNYVWLPVGEYKIYFIDDSYGHLQNPSYWLHNDPICISIVPENTVGTTVTRSSTTYGSASVTVENNIFCQGANIAIKYTTNNLTAQSGSELKPWLAISKNIQVNTGFFDYYTHWDYIGATESSYRAFNGSNGNSAQTQVASYKSLPEGSYKIHLINGSNLQTCIDYIGEPIGINIAHTATLKANLGNTSLLSTSSPYDVSAVEKTVTVTDADVEKGYITVSFSFEGLKTNSTYYLNVNDVLLTEK